MIGIHNLKHLKNSLIYTKLIFLIPPTINCFICITIQISLSIFDLACILEF